MWSQIKDTELELEAYVLMNENEMNGCVYHNNWHIEDMYGYLEETNEPYDEALDWAILFHDVVYDELPDKELRSAQVFMEMSETYRGCNLDAAEKQRVYDLILATVSHKIVSENVLPGNKAIIRADLHALTIKIHTIQNFTKIMDESMNLYGCSVEEFATNNIQFMNGLHQTMALNILKVNEEEKWFYQQVQNGIDLTIRIAQAVKDTK